MNVTKENAEKTVKSVTRSMDIKLNCGIGIGRTGRKLLRLATRALDIIRDLRDEGKIQPFYEIQCLW